MIFAFVFAFDSDSREGAPRPNPERMRRIYMAASVSSPVGREDVRAKGQRQRRKWIPAFAGMTNKSALPLVGTGRDLSLRRSHLLAMLFESEVRSRAGEGQFRARSTFSTPLRSGRALLHQPSFIFEHRGALRIFAHLPSWRRPGSTVESRRGSACRAGMEFPKNSIKLDKFTGYFDKFPAIYFLRKGRRLIAAQGNTAMARASLDDSKCANLRTGEATP